VIIATWGCAVARALGKTEEDFMKAYRSNIRSMNAEAVEFSPVGKVLMVLMKECDHWEGTATKLLDEMNDIAENERIRVTDKLWPKETNWLWRRIKVIRTNLQASGISINKDDSTRNTEGRKIIIKRISKRQINSDTGYDTKSNKFDSKNKNAAIRNNMEAFENASSDSSDSISGNLAGNDIKQSTSHETNTEIDPWEM